MFDLEKYKEEGLDGVIVSQQESYFLDQIPEKVVMYSKAVIDFVWEKVIV